MIIGLVLIVAVAVAIMAVVAAPRLRQGDELLTPEGRQSIVRAGQAAKEQSAAAAENTVQAVSSLKGKVSSAWSPASDFLHQQFDRLEARTDPHGTPRVDGPHPAEPAAGAAAVGAPRPVPAISGPIPIDDGEHAHTADEPAQPGDAEHDEQFTGAPAALINLRSPSPDEMKPQSSIAPDTNRRLY